MLSSECVDFLCGLSLIDGLLESRQDEVVIQDMNEVVFKKIIDYFYSGKLEINEADVQDLLSISGLLQLKRVQEACCEFMKRQINTNNCLGRFFQFSMSCFGNHSL